MRLLERYVLGELLRVFVGVLIVTTCLLVFVGVFEQVKERGFGPWQALQILPFIVPSLLPYTVPATLLLTVCVVYGRMAGDREIIAAKAAGVNIVALMWPSYFLGAVLSVCALLLLDQVIPWSLANIERTATLAMEDIFLDLLRSQNQVNLPERGITITVIDVRDRTLILPTIRYSPRGKKSIFIQAREARFDFDMQNQQVILQMKHVHLDIPGHNRMFLESETRPFPLMTGNQRTRGRNLRIRDIHREIAKAERRLEEARQRQTIETALILATGEFHRYAEAGYYSHRRAIDESKETQRRLRTELHNRFATSCSCFFFVLLGSPFAIVMEKKQFLTSFLFCFLPILLVYYPVSMMTQNLSKTGQLNPAWAVWAANALLLVAAAHFIRKVLQH